MAKLRNIRNLLTGLKAMDEQYDKCNIVMAEGEAENFRGELLGFQEKHV